jgi:hypothetical protein
VNLPILSTASVSRWAIAGVMLTRGRRLLRPAPAEGEADVPRTAPDGREQPWVSG